METICVGTMVGSDENFPELGVFSDICRRMAPEERKRGTCEEGEAEFTGDVETPFGVGPVVRKMFVDEDGNGATGFTKDLLGFLEEASLWEGLGTKGILWVVSVFGH